MVRTGEIEIPTMDDIDEYFHPVLDKVFVEFRLKVKEQLIEIGRILQKHV